LVKKVAFRARSAGGVRIANLLVPAFTGCAIAIVIGAAGAARRKPEPGRRVATGGDRLPVIVYLALALLVATLNVYYRDTRSGWGADERVVFFVPGDVLSCICGGAGGSSYGRVRIVYA
jgi:hypothetical protein